MDLCMRSNQNGILDLAMLSRGYGTVVDLATHLEHALLLFYQN